MLSRFVRLTGAVMLYLAACGGANALSVVTWSNDLVSLPTTNDGYNLSAVIVGGATYDHIGSCGSCLPPDNAVGEYRSPYQNPDGVNMEPGLTGQAYTSVRNGAVGYNFVTGQKVLKILWGSPDSYNTLEFWSGKVNGDGSNTGSLIGAITGTMLGDPQALGHHYMTFILDDPSAVFASIVLRSTQAAFEFAALTTGVDLQTELPLPPALVLFGSALVGLLALGRRRRREPATA